MLKTRLKYSLRSGTGSILVRALLPIFLLVAGCGRSGEYPDQAITIICPWSAGGGTDRLSRFMADELQARLGQPVVVVNKTGGSGAVGFAAGAGAPPDGYTITMATFELSTMHWMGISKLTYQNFIPLTQLNGDAAAILVRKGSPFRTLNDLLQHVRENPGQLKMSGTATGAAWDLARQGLQMAAGIPLNSVVWVPAQGAAPAIVDLLGGHVDAICCSVPEAMSQIESGELIALAVMSPGRLPEFPEIPTCKELGVEWEAVGWRGLALPVGTPRAIVKKLEDVSLEIAQSANFKRFMEKNGFAPAIKGPREFNEFLRVQDETWQQVILRGNIEAKAIAESGEAASHDPGPWALPTGLALFIGANLVYQAMRRSKSVAASDSSQHCGTLILPVLAFAIYLAVMPRIGFFVATSVLTLLAIRYLGRKWWVSGVAAVLLMTAVYLLFVRLFRVPLPPGFLF